VKKRRLAFDQLEGCRLLATTALVRRTEADELTRDRKLETLEEHPLVLAKTGATGGGGTGDDLGVAGCGGGLRALGARRP